MNPKYVIVFTDVQTGEIGTDSSGPYSIRAAADCRAIALDLQYPYREHSVVEIDPEKACGRTVARDKPGGVGGS